MPLRKLLILLTVFTCCTLLSKSACAFTKTPHTSFSDSNLYRILHLSVRDFQKITKYKLTFKEKIYFKIYKFHLNESQNRDRADSQRLEKRAIWAKRLGIGSLAALILPGVGLLSLPAAILAIIFGASTIKKVKNKKNSRQGITFGIITLGLILFLVALVVFIVIFPAG